MNRLFAVILGLALLVSPKWKQQEVSDYQNPNLLTAARMPLERPQRASRGLTMRGRVILWASMNYPSRKDSEAFVEIIWRESRFRANAVNRKSGAYGLAQALPADKYESVASDWRTNPWTQLKWATKYIRERYGTPTEALRHHNQKGWY